MKQAFKTFYTRIQSLESWSRETAFSTICEQNITYPLNVYLGLNAPQIYQFLRSVKLGVRS